METNEKLIAVVEIGGDKATQFWARADDLAQAYLSLIHISEPTRRS